jgi:uncharacterized protein YdeI (BOF family)
MRQRTLTKETTIQHPLQRLTLVVLMLMIGAILAACGGTEQQTIEPSPIPGQGGLSDAPDADQPLVTSPEVATGSGEAMAITLSDIADNPEQYLGQIVTIRAPLGEVIGPRAFTLSDPALLDFDSLLVVGASESAIPTEEGLFSPDAAEPVEDAEIEVTGTVRQFDQPTLEQELAYEFPDPLIGNYSGQTAIVADDVRVLTQGDSDSGAVIAEPLPTAGAATDPMIEGEGGIVTLSDIDDNVEQYIGQTVTVNGEVDEALGANAFRMDEGGVFDLGDQILVVLAGDAQRPANLQNETSVQVMGEVQNFARADFERDYGLIFDDEALYAEWEGRPTIVASMVTTRATVSDIDDDAEAYIGNQVAVQGDVTEIIDERTFRLDDPALLGGDDILVTTAQAGMTVTEGDQVWVSGVVREFDRTALGQETGYDYSGEIYDPFAERTVIVADTVRVTGQASAGFFGDTWDDNTISFSDIADNPEAYVGQQVTLSGEVSQAIDANTFRMDEDNWLDIGDDLLVVLRGEAERPANLQDETNVQVTGEVRTFNQTELEQELGLSFDPALAGDWANQAVIIADQVYVQATLSDIDDNPDAYLGNRVSVFGAVEEVYGPGQIRLEDPQLFAGDDVLVLLRDQSAAVNEGDYLRVTGLVQRFNQTEVEQELGVSLEGDWLSGWTDRTVIIADTVLSRARP